MLRRVIKRNQFKAKGSVYYLLGWVVILTFLSFAYQHLTQEWIIASASEDLELMRVASHQVRSLNEENSQLKEINSTLVEVLGTDSKPVVVKVINDGSAKSKAMFKARQKWGDAHLASFEQLMNHESGYNPSAQNPKSSAFGMFQFMDSTWKSYGCTKTEEVETQIDCGLKYIEKRYGDPTNAWKHWLARVPINGKDYGHWY